MKKRLPIFAGLYALSLLSYAQDPSYYKSAFGKKDANLKSALSVIISNAKTMSYDDLYDLYETTDKREDGTVWDVYSSTTKYSFSNKCGNYSKEGDCYNREHSVPQSWFNRSSPMRTDAWHVIPSDGSVNGKRSNHPFGEVGTASYLSNGSFSKLGSSSTPGYTGTVFEPNDLYKGDIARIYFYMATRYEDKVGNWGGGVFSSSYPHLQSWVVNLMLKWHRQDPVSTKEKNRNEAMHDGSQGNRNPFIDYPHLVELIFGNRKGELFQEEDNGGSGGDVTDPVESFEMLEADNITNSSFRINWKKDSNADDYLVDVYTKENAGDLQETLFDFDLSNGGVPAGCTATGTYKENYGLRLATGSNDGILTFPKYDLSQGATISIECIAYNTDNSTLYIYVDNNLIEEITCQSGNNVSKTVSLTGTVNSVISLKALTKKRVVLKSVKAETGASSCVKVDGYPKMAGDVNNVTVENLEKETTYFYSVTPYTKGDSGKKSEEMSVTTVDKSTSVDYIQDDQILSYYFDGIINIVNAPKGSHVMLFDISGKKVLDKKTIQSEEAFEISKEGIYIMNIRHNNISVVRKVLVD